MESRLLTLVVVFLGIFSQFYTLPAVSLDNRSAEIRPLPPPPTLPPPRPAKSPSPSPSSSPPPPSSPSPRPPPSPSPPPRHPRLTSHPPPPSPAPSPNSRPRSPPISPAPSNDSENNVTGGNSRLSSGQGFNLGKKIGIMFLGIVGIVQVCVVAFLVIKRRQLLQANDRY